MKNIKLPCLLLVVTIFFTGCALGKKEWPSAVKSEDRFSLELLSATRTDECLSVTVAVSGAVHRLYRTSILYEQVGGPGGGCEECPFVPRKAKHVVRGQAEFNLKNNIVSLGLCNLSPEHDYRFRIAGKSELSISPIVYTDVYVTTH